jgi:hypothetical protein
MYIIFSEYKLGHGNAQIVLHLVPCRSLKKKLKMRTNTPMLGSQRQCDNSATNHYQNPRDSKGASTMYL